MLCAGYHGSLDSSSVDWVRLLFRPLTAKLVTQMLMLQHVHVELCIRSYRLVSTGRLRGREKPCFHVL